RDHYTTFGEAHLEVRLQSFLCRHGRCSPRSASGSRVTVCRAPSCRRLVRSLYVLFVSIVAAPPRHAARSESAVPAAHLPAVGQPKVQLFSCVFRWSVPPRRSPLGTLLRSAPPPGFSGKARRMPLGSCQ